MSRADAAPDPTTVWEQLERRVAATPDGLFLVDEDGRRLTFSEFRQAAHETAAGLTAHGIGPGTVVAWALPTKIDTCVLMAALSRLSVVQVPIVPIYREREVSHIIHEAEVDVVLVGPPQRGVDYAVMIRSMAADRGGRPRVFELEGPLPKSGAGLLPPPPVAPRANPPDPVRWYFYTSGSTGRPKGVRHTDSGLAAVARGMADHLEMVPSDRSGLAFPIAHVGGPINLLASFMSGTALILIESFDPPRAVETLRREGVTMAGSGTAFHLGYLDVQRQHPHTPIFPRLRCCPGGGAPKPPGLHREIKEELGGAGILSGWGLTEAPVLTMGRPNDPDEKLSLTEGRPLAGVELRVVSPEGVAVADGEVGELRVRGPQMMQGYVDPSLDVAAFDEGGFIRTGDLGAVDDEGFVTITGRLKDVVIRNGENIWAAEVEELVRLHPAVVDAVVVGLPDERTGERLCAVIELRAGHDPFDVTSLAAHLETKGLRRQAWPERVENMPALPRTIAGKVDKPDLQERFSGAPGPDTPAIEQLTQRRRRTVHDQTQGRPPEGDWLGTPYVRFERKGSLASCIVDRPEARNAMTGAMYFAVRYAVDVVNADPTLSGMLLTGTGDVFIPGGDLGGPTMDDWGNVTGLLGMDTTPFEAIRNSRKPIVSAVNGICQGGGLLMAMLSDVTVASERATFRAPELYRGIADMGYAAFLPAQIGPARARDLLFTGRTLDAQEACAWGLVTRVTEHDHLLDEARSVLSACCRTAPQARLAVKRAVNEVYGRYDRMSMDESLAGPECLEGWLAFKERRSPSWVAEELRQDGRL